MKIIIRILSLSIAVMAMFIHQANAQGVVTRPPKQANKQATKTTKANKGNIKSKTQAQTNKPSNGIVAGHEWVDLGLPSGVKWATCNLGAYSPEQLGNYFAWGETSTKNDYSERLSRTYDKSEYNLSLLGFIDSDGQLKTTYDAARSIWGASWRMPTNEEFEELYHFCKRKWTSVNGRNGILFTGPNMNSIFFPASGFKSGSSSTIGVGERGDYWSSSLGSKNEHLARGLHFHPSGATSCANYRHFGFPIRPVTD